MKIVSWILSLYPRGWRERYQEEMMALLEEYTITLKTIFDLLLGALDARLDPSYRTKEGFMFRRFHDVRFLSYIYVCALAIFLVAINCWALTIDAFGYWLTSFDSPSPFIHSAPMGITIAGPTIVTLICFFTLISSAFSTLCDAFKNRSFGVVLFALLCLGLSIVVASPFLAEGIGWGIIALVASVSFFVAGIKGLKMLKNRQSGPLLFAILIGVIVPSMLLLYESVGLSSGINNISSWQDIVRNFGQFIPYISIGALLLTLADVSFSKQNWRLMRGFGVFLALLLAAEAAIVVIWDVSCWVAGNGSTEIYGSSQGIWALFGGQGLFVLLTNVLILIVMLALVVIALLRAFIIHPNRREVISQPLAV